MTKSHVHQSKIPATNSIVWGTLQRKCGCGAASGISGHCSECDRKRMGTAPPLVYQVLQSAGQSLDHRTRASMESQFGHDFSQVRIHADARAAESAQAVNALAYTVGNDIVFADGQYEPGAAQGQKVLAHELTHVIQQGFSGGAMPTAGITISGEDHHEHNADAAAESIAAGQQVHVSSAGISQQIQRWPWPWPFGDGKTEDDSCAGYEQDPESLSIETAKHFLDEVQPGIGSRLVKTTDCQANPNRPERFECMVTFDDGEVIQVSIESKLHNVEGQRPTQNGREWCVYHFTCGSGGNLQFEKKGCSYNIPSSPAPSGPDAVASNSGASGESLS
jgi:hypothetical protein